MATWQFRLAKVMDMGYITVVYAILSAVSLFTIKIAFGKYDEKEDQKKSSIHLFLEVLGLIWATAIFFYLIRNTVGDYLPSPFHGIAGYNHFKLKEFTSGSVFIYLFMQFFAPLKQKLSILYKRHFD